MPLEVSVPEFIVDAFLMLGAGPAFDVFSLGAGTREDVRWVPDGQPRRDYGGLH